MIYIIRGIQLTEGYPQYKEGGCFKEGQECGVRFIWSEGCKSKDLFAFGGSS